MLLGVDSCNNILICEEVSVSAHQHSLPHKSKHYYKYRPPVVLVYTKNIYYNHKMNIQVIK